MERLTAEQKKKVKDGLEHCYTKENCIGCVYYEQMKGDYTNFRCDCNRDALVLIQEQEQTIAQLRRDKEVLTSNYGD